MIRLEEAPANRSISRMELLVTGLVGLTLTPIRSGTAFIRCLSGRALDECGQDSKGLADTQAHFMHKKLPIHTLTLFSEVPQ
jgi:hypothetical protein